MTAATRRTTAALTATLVLGTLTVLAQQSPGRWDTEKYAKLPQPAEEYTPVQVNDKLYLIGGNAAVLTPGRAGDASRACHGLRPGQQHVDGKEEHPVLHGSHERRYPERQDLRVRRFRCDDARGAERDARYRVGVHPASDSWKALAKLNGKRTAGAAAELGGKIYFIGGSTDSVGPDGRTQNGGLVVGTNEVYDPATNRWETRKPMPTPRNHPAIGVVNGRIYLIGGRITANNIGGYVASNVDVVEEYNPATDSWRAMNRMPSARSGQGWTTYQGKIYVAGGEHHDYHIEGVLRDVEVFESGGQRLVPAAGAADRPSRGQRRGLQRQAVRNRRPHGVCRRRRPCTGFTAQRGVRVRTSGRAHQLTTSLELRATETQRHRELFSLSLRVSVARGVNDGSLEQCISDYGLRAAPRLRSISPVVCWRRLPTKPRRLTPFT